MAMKITGIEATLSTFREVDRRFTEAAGLALEQGAKDISELARMYAPVDKGDLVRSIRALRVNDSGSTKWRIKVGGAQGERDVSAYAALVHERMRITRGQATRAKGEKGDGFNPGWRSQKKAQALGVPVGGKFLERAFRERSKMIAENIRRGLANEVTFFAKRRKK